MRREETMNEGNQRTHGKEVENENDDEDERGGAGEQTKRSEALHLGHTDLPW